MHRESAAYDCQVLKNKIGQARNYNLPNLSQELQIVKLMIQ